jgi:hypothetical protein
MYLVLPSLGEKQECLRSYLTPLVTPLFANARMIFLSNPRLKHLAFPAGPPAE